MDLIPKTRRRFMWLMMLATTAVMAAALVAVYWLTYNSQEASNRRRLNSFEEVRITENGTVTFGNESTDAVVVERTSPDIGSYFSMLVDRQGKILTTFSSEEATEEQYQAAADIAWLGKNYGKTELEGRTWQYSVSPAVASITMDNKQQLRQSDGTYQIRFVDITESHQTLGTLALTLAVIGVALLLVFLLFSLFFSKRAIQPLVDVLEKQQRFVADASHELKTPVSIIKANCSVLYANQDAPIAGQREWLDGIATGADRMTRLIQSLIALAKIEGADSETMNCELSLGQLLDETLDMLDLMMQEKALIVETSYGTDSIWSDPDRVRQVLNIVLDNAIKYADPGGRIHISTIREKKWMCLSVFNTGSGIGTGDLVKIFDRFYRAEGARTQDGSYGLGLSIAQTVMAQLGGAITAESEAGQGATFVLRFPLKKER